MAGSSMNFNINVTAETSSAKQSLQDLQNTLANLTAKPIEVNDSSLLKANQLAVNLQQNLQKAMNPNTGKLDLTAFASSLKTSKQTLSDYSTALNKLGPEGSQAFLQLGRTIAMAEAPTSRLNKQLIKFGNTIKNTINWQISSSLIHGVVGQFQTAINYAESLNTSLNNIRIVTGQNTDQMAVFAEKANAAAKKLSTTTTQYTNASLIYYQQGLGDKEVRARTETTLKLANVSKQSVEEVSNQLTAIWNNYADGADNLQHYADVITALGAATAASSSEIATGLEKFAAIGKTVGLSYENATAALATITATTRQSAETVGTGLRTLFSRLQGLSLGETLEDGVNLNKYSAALGKVGVNIQDQYGKVKDMDQILGELGMKWGTISKEQQIALAQTVGGVRQYTNLIALMDNYGEYQKNLDIAKSSDGTLDKQASIYEESWSAATKRARASAESIYSSLIDDKAVIKLIDGFSGFLDLIHGVVEGLGGMKGVLLSVSSIFMNQYAKNIPSVMKGIKSGFQSITGIGMVKTEYGNKVDAATYALQQQHKAAYGAIANDKNANMGDRIAARGNLALMNMNQAYQARMPFMTQQEQDAAKVRLANTENQFKILEEQARKESAAGKEEVDAAKDLIRSNASNKFEERTNEEQEALNKAVVKAETRVTNLETEEQERKQAIEKLPAAKEEEKQAQEQAEKAAIVAKHSQAGAKGAQTQYENTADKAEFLKNIADDTLDHEDKNDSIEAQAEARKKEAAAEKAKQTASQKQELAEKAKEAADEATKKRENFEKRAAEDSREKDIAEAKDKASKARIAALTPEEAAKEILRNQGKRDQDYISQEQGKYGRNRPAYNQQQAGFADYLMDKAKQEGVYQGAATAAEQGKKMFQTDIEGLDAARKQNWIQAQKKKEPNISEEDLNKRWKNLPKEDKAKEGRLGKEAESQMLTSGVNKGKKYRENLMASIDNQIADEKVRDALKQKVLGASLDEQGKDKFDEAENLTQVQNITAAIADAIKDAIQNGIKGENGEDILQNEEDRARGLGEAADLVGQATGTSGEELLDYALRVEGTGEQQFRQEYQAQQANNPEPDEPQKSKFEEDPFGAVSQSIGNLAAAAGAATAQVSAVSNAFSVLGSDTATFGEKLGAAAGALSGFFMNAGQIQQSAKSIFESFSKTAPSWIGAAVSAIGSVVGIIQGYIEQQKAEIQERRNEEMDEAREIQQKSQQNSELMKSYESAANNYQIVLQQYKDGIVTAGDLAEAKQGMIESASQVTESYKGIAGASAAIVSADTEALTEGIASARIRELRQSQSKQAIAREAAAGNLEDAKITGMVGQTDFDGNITGYSLNFGLSYRDEEKAAKILQEQGLTGDLGLLTSAEERLEVYDKLSNAYELMSISMTDAEKKSSEYYKSTGKLLNEWQSSVEAYKEFRDYEYANDIELMALGEGGFGRASKEITDLESYNKYRQALIEKIATDKDIEEGTQEYTDLVNQIDSYLSTLSNVTDNEKGNLYLASKAMEELVENQMRLTPDADKEKIQQEIMEMYNDENIGDKIFQINGSVKIDSDEFKTELALLQAMADDNKIQVQIDLVKDFNLDAFSGSKAWSDFGQDIDKDLWKEIFGEDFDLNQYAAMTTEERTRLNQQYMTALNAQRYSPGGTIDQEIAKAEERRLEEQDNAEKASRAMEETQFSSNGLSYSDVHQNADKITWSNKELDDENKATEFSTLTLEEYASDFIRARELAKNAGITETEQKELAELRKTLNAAGIGDAFIDDENYGSLAEKYAREVTELNNATQAVADYQNRIDSLRAEQQAYANFGFRDILANEAQQWGIDYEEIIEYANYLRDIGTFTKDAIKESERFALAVKKQEVGIKSLTDNYKTWGKYLKETDKGLPAVEVALKSTKKALSGILDVPVEDISDDFVQAADSAGLLEMAATGSEDAIMALQKFAGEQFLKTELFFPKDGEISDNLVNQFQNIYSQLTTMADGSPITIGTSIDQTGALDALQALVLSAGMSAEQANAFLSSIGYDPTVTMEEYPFTAATSDEQASGINGFIEVGGNTIPYYGSLDNKAEVNNQTVIRLPKIDGGNTKFKGAAGSPSSGGGGGGGKQKKKDHKKPDISTRYHTINAKQSNNEQSKQEANREKERAFGAEKIKQAQEEIKLQKESIVLQRQYVDEITDYLADDKKKMLEAFTPGALGFDLGFDININSDGVIENYRQLEEKLLEEENKLIDQYNAGGLDDEGYEEAQKKIDDAREYLKIYEETRDLYESEWDKLSEYLDELADQALELTKMKVELDISISDDDLEVLDYFLKKIDDDAYQAAESIALLGDKTDENLKRIEIYQNGLEEILQQKGFSLENLNELTDKDLLAANFTQDEIDQIREWRSELLKANEELIEMRKTIIDKVLDSFDELNDKVSKSYDRFDHYNTILEDYKNITDLLGVRLNQQQKALIDQLGKATLENAKNQLAASKTIYDQAQENMNAAQRAYDAAIASGDTAAAQQWEKVIEKTQEELDSAQEQWLESWQAALEKAQELYEQAIDDVIKKYEESISGVFGSLDYLQDAFDRAEETNGQYLQDFEKLYEFSKLNRDIQAQIDDTTNIRDKKVLRDLQKEINKLQEDGVQVSQYDVDVLRKKFELEQARMAIEDARNNKSEVRLQRDANGNWGYVYTAQEDEVAKAEQEYETKLYEYQKLNDDYMKELQGKIIGIQTQYEQTLKEIYTDSSLNDEQRKERIAELNAWLEKQQEYLSSQLDNAMKNQNDIYDVYLDTYDVSSAGLVDAWEKTTLGIISNANTLKDYMDNWKSAVDALMEGTADSLNNYKEQQDEINDSAGVSTDQYIEKIADDIADIGTESDKSKQSVKELSEVLTSEFTDALKAAIDWEEKYTANVNAAIEANENFVKSLNDIIAKLAELESSAPGLKAARAAYQAAEAKHEEFIAKNGEGAYDEEWEQAKITWNKYLDEYLAKFDTGGYTGDWNSSDARLAFVHEKELVLNKYDTENLLKALEYTKAMNQFKSDLSSQNNKDTRLIQEGVSLLQDAYAKGLENIFMDSSLNDSQRESKINELNNYLTEAQDRLVNSLNKALETSAATYSKGLYGVIAPNVDDYTNQPLEQNVHIEATFPGITDHNEIELAFDNLINKATQYANRKNMSSMTFQDMYTSKF